MESTLYKYSTIIMNSDLYNCDFQNNYVPVNEQCVYVDSSNRSIAHRLNSIASIPGRTSSESGPGSDCLHMR